MTENTKTTVVSTLYVAAWTGGYEDPNFFTSTDSAQAIAKAESWAEENDSEGGSRVDVLLIETLSDGSVETRISNWEPTPQDEEDDSEDEDTDED